jgi:hypothetical protein
VINSFKNENGLTNLAEGQSISIRSSYAKLCGLVGVGVAYIIALMCWLQDLGKIKPKM